MTFPQIVGNLLGIENVESIDQLNVTLAAPWAASRAWVLFGCVLLMAASLWFYRKYQRGRHPAARTVLAVMRGLLLGVLFVILADPVLRIAMTNHPRPLLYVLFDGTDSMAIEERPADEYRAKLNDSLGTQLESGDKISRVDCVRRWLTHEENNVLDDLDERFRLRLFSLDQRNGVRALRTSAENSDEIDPDFVAEQLTTMGQVTALGNGVQDMTQRHSAGQLAGMVIVSDFVSNGGRKVVGSSETPARKFGRPIYTVGVGVEEPAELVVDCQAKPFMKNKENYTVHVNLKQTRLKNKTATVRLFAVSLDGDRKGERRLIGTRDVELAEASNTEDFPYKPQDAGRYRLVAEVDRFPEEAESADKHHLSESDVEVGDNFVRLMYVAHEPTWEWRFIKEVFHRDPRVGTKGFRTYLASSDPNVRRTNELFLPTLAPPRREFFANDIIFLGDMPRKSLSPRFCKWTHEFVTQFGGGLVVLAGPRFGPSQLVGTPIEDILPVTLDRDARMNDKREFRLSFTEDVSSAKFMRLGGDDPKENEKVWNNLGRLPWFQPVLKRSAATGTHILAEHPTEYGVDSKPQPLIAIRDFPASGGKVVYLGFNEMWRLRRKYGEKYYGQFWGQVFNELGFRRRSGYQKRFVVKTDRPDGKTYTTDDKVVITVDAYDENFDAIDRGKVTEGQLTAELTSPGSGDEPPTVTSISIPFSRDGVFETRIPVYQEGEYQLRVRDPIKNEFTEPRVFRVTSISAERTNAQRDFQLERDLARETNGESFDITRAWNIADVIEVPELKETTVRVFPLWNTWFCFGLVLLLMLTEWAGRKWIHLP